MVKAMEVWTGFVPYQGSSLEDILCEHYERVVGNDNCVSFCGRSYQIPKDQNRLHYVKVNVRVHRYSNGDACIFRGPRKLAGYDAKGDLLYPVRQEREQPAADVLLLPVLRLPFLQRKNRTILFVDNSVKMPS